MDAVVEVKIKTNLLDRFDLGHAYPEPVVMEDGKVILINSQLHLAVIKADGSIFSILKPIQRTFISDTSLPIFREAGPDYVLAFYPDSRSIFSFDLTSDDSNCQNLEYADLYFAAPANEGGRASDEIITDWNFFYSAPLEAYYFVATVLESTGQRLVNRIYKLEVRSKGHPTLIDSYESANRPYVQQTDQAIMFGMMKNHELIVLVERGHAKPVKLLIENFMRVAVEDQTVSRMIVAVGLIEVQGRTLLLIMFNDDTLQAGSQIIDITDMRVPPGQDIIPLHREDKSMAVFTARNNQQQAVSVSRRCRGQYG